MSGVLMGFGRAVTGIERRREECLRHFAQDEIRVAVLLTVGYGGSSKTRIKYAFSSCC